MKKMQAAVLYVFDDFRQAEIPVPELGVGEVLKREHTPHNPLSDRHDGADPAPALPCSEVRHWTEPPRRGRKGHDMTAVFGRRRDAPSRLESVRRVVFAAVVLPSLVVLSAVADETCANLSKQEGTTHALEPFPDGARVAFYGDSITADGGWVMRVAAHYRKEFPERDIRFYNCGISGGGFRAAEMYFDWILSARKPTHVVLAFGVNDSRPLRVDVAASDAKAEHARIEAAAADFRKKYAALVGRVQGLGVSIILRTATPYNEFAKKGVKPIKRKDAAHKRVADEILAFARERGLPVIDDYTPLKASLDRGEKVLKDDRVHPNDRGQWYLAKSFLAVQGLNIAPFRPRKDETASAGIREWTRLTRRLHSVYATEWLFVRDESLSLDAKLAKVRKWLDMNKKLPKGDYCVTICRDYLELRPKMDKVLADLETLWLADAEK